MIDDGDWCVMRACLIVLVLLYGVWGCVGVVRVVCCGMFVVCCLLSVACGAFLVGWCVLSVAFCDC